MKKIRQNNYDSGNKKKGKGFYKLLISYFAILLIPLLFSLIIFRLNHILLTPLNIYDNSIDRIVQIDILFIFLFTLSGSILGYIFTQRKYRRIQDIFNLICIEEDLNISKDEIDIILRKIQMNRTEGHQLKKEIRENRPLLGQREIWHLLKGEAQWDQAIEQRLKQFGVQFDKSLFLLVLFDIEPEDDTPPSLRYECSEILRNREIGDESIYIIRNLDGCVAYLINSSDNCFSEIFEQITRLQSEIEREHSVTVAVGMSMFHDQSEGFNILYREAQQALEYRLVKGSSSPIVFDDIRHPDYTYYYPLEEEKKLIAAIRSGSDQDAFNILDHVIKTNFEGERFMAVEMAQCLMNDLIATLIKSLDQLLSQKDNFWSGLKPISRLTACKSFKSLKSEMESILYDVCKIVKKEHKSHNIKLKEGIISYVNEHFTESSLCIDSIAKKFERNPAYLARFFKEQTSLGLAAHIKQIRINKSFDLLKIENKTIAAIASEVGFSNVNAYIRVFKEMEGLTPGQYRTHRIN